MAWNKVLNMSNNIQLCIMLMSISGFAENDLQTFANVHKCLQTIHEHMCMICEHPQKSANIYANDS